MLWHGKPIPAPAAAEPKVWPFHFWGGMPQLLGSGGRAPRRQDQVLSGSQGGHEGVGAPNRWPTLLGF